MAKTRTGKSKNLAEASRRVVLVTGMSGAGRTTALKALEDLGYEAVDNLPLSLLGGFVRTGGDAVGPGPLAIGVDIRTRDFDDGSMLDELDRLLAAGDTEVTVLFLDCDDDVLIRRFTETRRRHPLAADRPVADGLRLERRKLARLRERADPVIDTSLLSPGALKDELARRLPLDHSPGLAVMITSFSFRHGLPREADLVFDARFLENPYYDPELRPLSGKDAKVAEAVQSDADFKAFFGTLESMMTILLPRFEREGKSYLTIAIGCTGGRHRSVFLAEKLAAWLAAQGRRTHLNHRDIDRGGDPNTR